MAKKNKQSIEAEIKEYKDLIAAEGVPQDEKDFAADEIKTLEKELEKFTETPAKEKNEKPAKERDRSKEIKKRVNSKLEQIEIEIEGKKVKLTEANCFDVMKKLGDRIQSAKKSQGKYKTKPVTQKVGDNLKQAASQAVDAVTENRIENNSKDVIKGAQIIEAAYEKLFEGFEKMTGKKIPAETKKEIMGLLNGIIKEAKEE